MAFRLRTVRDHDEFIAALSVIGHYFGWSPTEEDAGRFSRLLPLERMHAVFDDGRIVAGAGVFPFRMTVPGGDLACAGVTVVGVLPSHRRRGLLRRMMDAQLSDVRERGEPIAALWASEETIYGRFGYGLASTSFNFDAERSAVAIRSDLPREASLRLVAHDEALRAFPRVYDRVAKRTAGMIVRSRDWWESRRLGDGPEQRRGAGPLVRALAERDGRPVGYALYRVAQDGSTPETWTKTVRVSEAFGVDDGATRDVWRFLLEIDWVDRITGYHLPLDHPLPLLVDRINKLRLSVWDALWMRVVDVPAALAGRAYASPGRATVEVVSDPHFHENVGSWTIEDGDVRPARRRPDVRVAVSGLGSTFLGGLSFAQLARAGLAEEGARGGIDRADELFRTSAAPWCPENF
jgi:predicted acetyltransferase